MTRGCIAAGVVIVVWGVTFASTRVLLEDFSSLEIIVLRFLLAWVALWSIGRFRGGNVWQAARLEYRNLQCFYNRTPESV